MTSPANLSLSSLDGYIELYDLDATGIGGAYYRFTSTTFSAANVNWQGHVYVAIPIMSSGWERLSSSSASPKPKLSISNVAKVLLPAVIAQGDLVGAKLTRTRTFAKFLDDGETPDPTSFFMPTVYFVEQKTSQDNTQIEWQLSSMLDREGLRLPREQVLKDVNFPGVSIYRQR